MQNIDSNNMERNHLGAIRPAIPLRKRDRIQLWLKRPLRHKFNSIYLKARTTVRMTEDMLFEKIHGLDCRGIIPVSNLGIESASSSVHANPYEAVSCSKLRRLINTAHKAGFVFDNFIDIGSGKGKACFYTAKKYKFTSVIGVEFSQELVKIANHNRSVVKENNISFINCDARDFSLPAGNNLIFLFNPFDDTILEEFIKRNLAHFTEFNSVIAYVNDKHRMSLLETGFDPFYRDPEKSESLYCLKPGFAPQACIPLIPKRTAVSRSLVAFLHDHDYLIDSFEKVEHLIGM